MTTTELYGTGAAPGAALGPPHVLPERTVDDVPARRRGSAEEEIERLDEALEQATADLEELAAKVRDAGLADEAEIFEAHAMFADDPDLRELAVAEIEEEGASAERAVKEGFASFREKLAASSSEYLAARADDLDDVALRVVATLQGTDLTDEIPGEVSVVVARDLTPSRTAALPRELIAAIVVETGSPTSHAAILARALGIPAVVACEGAVQAARDAEEIAVDGRDGVVHTDPDDELRSRFEDRIEQEEQRRRELEELRDEPGGTADGRRVELAANIGGPDDIVAARDAGAEGSGLVRTEFLFQGRRTAPSIDEQTSTYTEILEGLPGHRVVFRTMDIGADKPLPFVTRDEEENPALGLRGIRLHLSDPDLLDDQLRAMLRAASSAGDDAGRLAIMFPLVATVAELRAARERLAEVAEDEDVDLDGIEVGVMVEVPSAALGAARLAREADFLSIGTNDLLQYVFAADRLNAAVGELAQVLHPDVLRLLGSVVEAAHAEDAWVGVCGEAASDPLVAAALVGLGVDELSMTRAAIPEVKDRLRQLRSDDCRDAVEAAIAEAADADEAREVLSDRLG